MKPTKQMNGVDNIPDVVLVLDVANLPLPPSTSHELTFWGRWAGEAKGKAGGEFERRTSEDTTATRPRARRAKRATQKER